MRSDLLLIFVIVCFPFCFLNGYLATAQLPITTNGVPCTIQPVSRFLMDGNFINQTSGVTDGSFDNQGTISITGNWTNSVIIGQVFSSNAGTVQFLGTANSQTIGGTAAYCLFQCDCE